MTKSSTSGRTLRPQVIQRAFRPWILILCVCFTSVVVAGCQSWHNSNTFTGLSERQQEKRVLQQAKHDPFPTPEQVGLK